MSVAEKHGVCAFCNSSNLTEIVNLGNVALAGAFLKVEEFATERRYLLRLCFCHECFAVQVADHAPPEALFNENYFYFSSSINTLREHFGRYATEVAERFLNVESAAVLEFGCNDGVLLKPLADQNIKTVIGVDPSINVISAIEDDRVFRVNNFFTEEVAQDIVERHGRLEIVMANNVYAHISDIQGTTRAVKAVLKEDGVFIFEVHYLGKVLEELQYDMIYHEHLYYYSMLSVMAHFERYNMTVFDVKHIPIHAGSVRFYVCNKGSRHSDNISQAAIDLETQERQKKYDQVNTFKDFSAALINHRNELIGLLDQLKTEGKKIAGYGASGRANTIIQFCGITHEHLDFMIDDAPAKIGFYTPGSHLEIRGSDALLGRDAPDYVVVFAWSFFEEVRNRNETYLKRGGKMIVPLPRVRIIEV